MSILNKTTVYSHIGTKTKFLVFFLLNIHSSVIISLCQLHCWILNLVYKHNNSCIFYISKSYIILFVMLFLLINLYMKWKFFNSFSWTLTSFILIRPKNIAWVLEISFQYLGKFKRPIIILIVKRGKVAILVHIYFFITW